MRACHIPIFGASYGRLAAILSRTAVGDEEPRMCAVMCRLCAQGWVEIKASPVHGKGLFTTELFLNFIEVTADGELDGEQEKQVKEWRRESFHALYGFHCQCPLCIN
jgi:hypothetical protein